MTDYAYGLSIPYALAHGVPWRLELQFLLENHRNLDVSPPPWRIDNPQEATVPCLWRTLPPNVWFEAQERMAVDAPVPATACHPDDLRWLRSLTGLHQAEFANTMGTTQAMISRKENGVDLITHKFYDRVLQAVLDSARSGPGAITPERMDVMNWLLTRAHDGAVDGDSLE